MLADPSPAEREILGAIRYQRNEAVLHTDERLLPRRRRAWASWNFHLLAEPAGRTTITYHLNRLQGLRADREFCVTLNRTEAIDPAPDHPDDRLQPPRLHPGRRRGPGPPRGGQRTPPHTLLRGLLALGISRGRGVERAAGVRCAGARPSRVRWRSRRERLGDLRGLGQSPARRTTGALSSATGSS